MARYPVPREGAAVIGAQKAWFTGPFDLSPGNFALNLVDGIEEAGDEWAVFALPYAFGKYRVRMSPVEPEPGEASGPLPDKKRYRVEELRFDQLDELPEGQGLHMPTTVIEVLPEGEGWLAMVTFASGEQLFRFEVLDEIEREQLPDVLSRQYGPHAKHTFDVYWPEGFNPVEDEPLPVFVNIHGGGWGALDKAGRRASDEAAKWNERGVAYVSVNYRYVGQFDKPPAMSVPVAAPLLDAARCLQYLRQHAGELGLDTSRVNLTGGSAGGATSAWLAMVDDQADPDSPDPVARQSTRVTCSTPHQAQTSLDPRQMRAWIPSITYGAHAFLTKDERPRDKAESFEIFLRKRDELLPAIQDFSAWHQASADDPPMLLVYGGQPDILPAIDHSNATHHPRFGANLAARLKEAGVEVYFWAGDNSRKEGHVNAENPRYDGWSGTVNFVLDQFQLVEEENGTGTPATSAPSSSN